MKKRCFAAMLLLLVSAALWAGPGAFDKSDFAQRRARLYEKMTPGSAVLLMSGDRFKDGDLYYFTGIELKGSIFFALKDTKQEILFLPPASPDYGVGSDVQLSAGTKAEELLGIPKTMDNTEFEKTVIGLLKNASRIYVNKLMDRPDPWHITDTPQGAFLKKVQATYPGIGIEDDFMLILGLQDIKNDKEIAAMKKAVEICGRGVIEAMKLCRPGLYEYHLEATTSYVFRASGGKVYFQIVGSGPNSVILHHRSNDRKMEAGDLVVLDVGAEYDHFGSDITRTFPVSGKFTAEQKKVYQIVLDVNKKMIAMAKPGITGAELNRISHKLIEEAGYGKYYNHGLSHPIGGGMGMTELKPGMIITIEPGIYIPEKGFGIRIEDDILITENGNINLSAFIPKEIADIEKVMKQESTLVKAP